VRKWSQCHWCTRGDQLRDVVEAEDRDGPLGLLGHLGGFILAIGEASMMSSSRHHRKTAWQVR
jgi:hypothetical protein